MVEARLGRVLLLLGSPLSYHESCNEQAGHGQKAPEALVLLLDTLGVRRVMGSTGVCRGYSRPSSSWSACGEAGYEPKREQRHCHDKKVAQGVGRCLGAGASGELHKASFQVV